MGILNVTPDSFSDGNEFFSLERAVERALEMQTQGADIIDIGGESTRPNAEPVTLEEELRRVVPVVERLSGVLDIPISVDTYKAGVARAALDAGAEIINDVSGFLFDSDMAAVVADKRAGAVVMHTRGTPQEMQKNTSYIDVVSEVVDALAQLVRSAVQAGVPEENIVVDPGIGFAKSREGNLEILRRLQELSCLRRPILIGPSRKSFTASVSGRQVETRLYSTAATVALGVANGASIIRVHDVREMRDVADMAAEIAGSCYNF